MNNLSVKFPPGSVVRHRLDENSTRYLVLEARCVVNSAGWLWHYTCRPYGTGYTTDFQEIELELVPLPGT